ncbi:MAG: hypothetical protein Q8P98_06780, partial [Candidatus Rokubacteria bacterium]|nr:hypothetical protein [Candidatus Rokubacteria bacterium]
MRATALGLLTAFGLLGIVWLAPPADAQAPTPPAVPATPGQPPSLILTAPTGPDMPRPGTGAVPGLTPTTLQQPPREYLPAPDGVRPFPRPTETQQVLTMEDAVKIALDNQPLILARIGDYQAQLQNIAIQLAPQLPQLTGQWGGKWDQSPSSVRNVTVQTRSLTTSATVTAQQLLW